MRQLPLFEPPSEWRPPTSLPDVPSGVVLAVDQECRDRGLENDRGAGWATRNGHIAGISVAWRQRGEMRSYYIPIRHPETECFDPERTLDWLDSAMRRAERVVFFSRTFDEGWLNAEGITVPESADDAYVMAVMLDENQPSYSLDACCKRAGVPGKDERALREAAAAFGLDPKRDLWRMPARYVGPYAEQDAVATLLLSEALAPQIDAEGLREAYRLEIDLIPMMIEMRRRGIRIDEAEAHSVQSRLRQMRAQVLDELREQIGWRRELTMDDMLSPLSLERIFDGEGVPYPRTPKTRRGSFKADWMEASDHWLPRMVTQARKINDLSEKFIGNYLLGSVDRGRVHAEIHQLRDDDGGTRSYRLSYANPPLQQMPARSKLAPLVRGIFLPEPHCLWGAPDFSQQEPRLAVHFASVCGIESAEDAVRYYCDDPGADFHTMVAELTGLTRKQAKIINLGLMYGMGLAKLAASLGVSLESAKEIVGQYNLRMPFVRKLADFCAGRASSRGFIKLLDGARCRFDLWEVGWRGDDAYVAPMSREKAAAAYPGQRIRRAHTHKAMNRLVQGSAARQTKMAMRECWRVGLVPLLQMHDELCFSFESDADGRRAQDIMENVVKLRIPMKVDLQYGHTWGQASEEMDKGVVPPTFDELMRYGRGMSNTEIVSRRAA